MTKLLLPFALAAVLSGPAAALQPETVVALKTLNLAPDAPDVALVADDEVNGTTLDTLAAKQDYDGIKQFIATRAFYHKFKKNPLVQAPGDDLYKTKFLTAAEKSYIAVQIQAQFGFGTA